MTALPAASQLNSNCYPPAPAGPPSRARGSLAYEAFRRLMLVWYRLIGWTVVGEPPDDTRFVVIAAPHTSNWDLPLMLCCALHWRVKLHWMGKDAIFKAPVFGALMRRLGGIPIDRSKSNDIVAQVVKEFASHRELAIAIPPEGTRGKVRYWKTGFYHIAHGAGVPIVLGFLDYEKKVGGIGGTLATTGNYDADMIAIRAFYDQVAGKYPDLGRPDADNSGGAASSG